MIHIGFTGTRQGMTADQQQALYDRLCSYATAAAWAFHHGDCQGSDEQAHAIAWEMGATVHIHPPETSTWRAYCTGPSRVLHYAPLPYLVRNRAMVEACTILFAAPDTAQERQRSGTWATVRYARQRGRLVRLLARTAPGEAKETPCPY
jgi:hypothetical protein